ncbi:unnamed protein product [Prunus armeniaca]
MEIIVIVATNQATNPTIVQIVGKLTWLKRMRMTIRIMVLMKIMKELISLMRKRINKPRFGAGVTRTKTRGRTIT